MNRFLQAVERARLDEHEQQVAAVRGAELLSITKRGVKLKTGRKQGVVVSDEIKRAIIKEYRENPESQVKKLAEKYGISVHCARATLFKSGDKQRGVDMRFGVNFNARRNGK